ncbi:hypothetical protein [Cytophaga aurantiaca]|uniref:hypothetical protein n=1 Tax=Cytophaga aurantiaca TaxID=29530 RepID=UPI00036F5837|nr:hypothetical protein [Cytophaga aurantiaca]
MTKYILTFLFTSSCLLGQAQVFSDRDNLKKDTVKQEEPYPYLLPIWGKKVAAKGFKLPYSGGLGLNYLWQKSDITVSNLQVGFNHGTMYNMDNIVHFNNATATSQGINIRPDVWVLPFLNVYGILAKSNSSTAIDIDLQIPTDPSVPGSDWQSIASFQTKANFQGTTAGFGLTPTMGIKGCWMAMDMNFTWTDIPQLDKPAFIYIFGPRVGKAFKLHKPDQNVTFWVGGFRLKMSSSTSGSMPIGDLFNTEGIEQKIDNGYTKIDDAQQNVDTWWAGLSPAEQQRPGNIAKKDAAENALAKAEATLDGLSTVVTNAEKATVQYSLSKRPTQMWNFLVGSQFQFNRHWMIRAEAGFFGGRTQVIAGLQYRFGL